MGIRINKLIKSFGIPPTQVLKNVNTEIKDGEMVAITGRSGSGKSTLLYIISTLDHATSGDIEIDGESLARLNSEQVHRFRNQKMGFVFQFHHLLPELTALENILMPAIKTKSQNEKTPFALELMQEFGIKDKADRLPSQLSGGEQQRVAIARALVMKPKYIFADEPTGNLDSVNGQIVMNLLKKINKEFNTTIIYVTHDIEFSRLAPRQINLVDGQIS
jgi:lipoprotein-releasing system ATP-binding protein